MGKQRVYELAKDLQMTSREVMRLMQVLNIPVKTHMSTLTEEQIDKIKKHLEKLQRKDTGTPKVSPAKEKKPAKRERAETKADKRHPGNGKFKQKPGIKRDTPTADHRKWKKEKWEEFEDDQEVYTRKVKGKKTKQKKKFAKPEEPAERVQTAIKKIEIGETVVVQDLAQKMGKKVSEVIKQLMNLGVLATINQEIDAETATLVAAEFGIEVKVKDTKPVTELEDIPDDPELLKERPPVVTVMGHVDHGKTSLLDAIRQTNVTATEAGGITQHIGAYQVDVDGKKITFLDTPGHEAFTAMRARGAQITDIAVLVVAADDGVMPQTVEAINHAKAANVPIIVAINKIDKPNANPERVKQELTEHGLIPEEWGGDTICVNVSALKREGIDNLLEMILLVAEMAELKANPDRPARGVVIEAELDKGRGPVATMLVQKGTLKVGDYLVAGLTHGRVRAMMDHRGQRIKKAGPSVPVEVLGMSDVPEPGDIFQVVEDEKLARQIAENRKAEKREEELHKTARASLDELMKQMKDAQAKELNIIIKADVHGSVEALRQALEQVGTEEVRINIIHGGVGAITETDVMLAAASNAIIIGFNVRPDANARKAAEKEKIDVRLYRVIYEVIDDIKAAMSGLLEPEIKEVFLGRAEVRATFKVPKVGVVAGCYVTEGRVTNNANVRIIRDGVVVHEGKVASLRRFKDDVREVSQGYECGMGIERFNDIKEGDVIEAYTFEKVERQL
ncbi:translation initiation factor IF-2 [Calderihabitans maritimus]|uniref:Translation initiation factor IF-2 n=1 Tax=Calderihabitans maritimus TaxID=1246530 RepID=A0A1Z5HXP2_9FIRM|nr:translation initiation factor IF-2 [Calderihabitans maritimus]GAW94303.1 translation initiation factor 2 [Calderihabitans maritimus]